MILNITNSTKRRVSFTAEMAKDTAKYIFYSSTIVTYKLSLKQFAMLTDEAKNLEAEGTRGSEPISGSPRQVHSSHGPRGSASPGHRELYSSADSTGSRTFSGPGSRSRRGSQ